MKTIEDKIKSYKRVAIQLDNSTLWLALDDLLTRLNKVIVPVPHFFSSQQILHMVTAAGIDAIFCDSMFELFWKMNGFNCIHQADSLIVMVKNQEHYPPLPENTHKITFTSGTTSEPKGVCLSLEHLRTVGQSLADISKVFKVKSHLSLLPLSVLLENMAANYAAKYTHINVITPSLSEIGLSGSSALDVEKMLNTIIKYQAHSLIVMPQMLKAIVTVLESNEEKAKHLGFLKFIAVGGAICSKALITRAHALHLPVYEGYGISECGSVISLNTSKTKQGSVGKALPHLELKLNTDGEIMIRGPLFLGYLGQKKKENQKWFATGDLGQLDSEQCLSIIGRKNNIIINSFGRNISPDWIEAELLAIDEIKQVVVYGEGLPFLTAICITALPEGKLMKKISQINLNLPDYARISQVIVDYQAFTLENGLLTASGKNRHTSIYHHYRQELEKKYASL